LASLLLFMFQTGSWLRKGRKSSLARSTAALDDEIMRPKSALRLWSDSGAAPHFGGKSDQLIGTTCGSGGVAAPHFGGKSDQLIRGGNFETTGEAARASLEDYGCRKEIVKIIQTSTVQR
jgi:hypothetical protein